MKKQGVLNHQLAGTIARMGHTDTLVIADAGLPIPQSTERIDLAVTAGVPSFLDVLRAVAGELVVERVTIARELAEGNPALVGEIERLIPGVAIDAVPHGEFKVRTRSAMAVVRTGECTPYANVILSAGVAF